MRTLAIGTVAALAALTALATPVAAGPAPVDPPSSAGQHSANTDRTVRAERNVRNASVHGKARISYIESLDHDIRFSVHAEQRPFTRPLPGLAPLGLATDAVGTLTFSHSAPGGGDAGWAEARVDCLVTSPRTATLTAVVTRSNVTEVGSRLGISVQQGAGREPDRLGFSWGVVNVDPGNADDHGSPVMPQPGTCMAPAPFTTVIKGGYEVVHAEITKTPVSPAEAIRRG